MFLIIALGLIVILCVANTAQAQLTYKLETQALIELKEISRQCAEISQHLKQEHEGVPAVDAPDDTRPLTLTAMPTPTPEVLSVLLNDAKDDQLAHEKDHHAPYDLPARRTAVLQEFQSRLHQAGYPLPTNAQELVNGALNEQ